ncbi:MAG: PD40 domain-containing protein [Bacteroidales bacterium]|nr:PD40 domain-containing protein [Bacteroidales bacterium]
MKKALLAALAALICTLSIANETPRWLRQNAISPDGSTVAFVYQGDIWLVPAAGGEATQLTTNPAHDTEPLWSPDGKYIIFASFREGQKDLWAISTEGGRPKRLTDYGGAQTPYAVSKDGKILFGAYYQELTTSSAFPGAANLYALDFAEALAAEPEKLPQPKRVASVKVGSAAISAAGVILYDNIVTPEDPYRKHHTSSAARDIWMLKDGKYTKLTSFIGEDLNPVFAPDGLSFYFVSERTETPVEPNGWAGDANVWKSDINGAAPVRVTNFKDNPVRYLSISANGILCYSWNGDLYTQKEGQEPVKLAISIKKDKFQREHTYKVASDGVNGFAASPNGKEVAVVSHGDVFVTPLELGDTRRITDTPEAERGVAFGKDGRSIFYASERGGEWAIYKRELPNKKDQLFTFTTGTKEKRITPEGQVCFQPSVSPDGKWLAYLRNRTALVICSTDGGKEKVLIPEGVNYSYSDGDLQFEWSPDSRYILSSYQGEQRMYNEDICLIDIESGEITDLTLSGYSDTNFKWAMGGKAMTWENDKAGYRSHGSWGAEGDIYIMFFDDEAYTKFTRGEDMEKIEGLLKSEKQAAKDKKKEDKEKKDSTSTKKPENLKLELDGRFDRVVRLTRNSGHIGDYLLTPDGKKLYYTIQLEKNYDLVCADRKTGDIKVVKKNFTGRLIPAADGKNVFVVGRNSITKADPNNFSTKGVSFRGEYEYDAVKEREYIFEHCWRQVSEKWYVADMHGVDWAAVGANYRQFLPYITDNWAFRELLSEMLGELNGSHTGGRYRVSSGNIGHLGVIFDEDYSGKGLKVKEFLPYSVLKKFAPKMKEGELILAVDGKPVEAGTPWYRALSRTSGKRILLTVKEDGKEKDIILTPGGNDTEGYYQRWVRGNEKRVEELSGGRVGYVHVRGMNSASFREVYSKALGKYRTCDALIVDTRNNGGGWLHNDLATFLDGKMYTKRQARGVYMAPEPYDKWVKPSCVVVCEANYSDACGFPYCYRALGTGKIIGAPVPGTATSVWWENQVDPTLVFGIPQIGSWSVSNGRYLENLQLEPDILVYNDPESVARGEDKQLEAAVAEMLKEIEK